MCWNRMIIQLNNSKPPTCGLTTCREFKLITSISSLSIIVNLESTSSMELKIEQKIIRGKNLSIINAQSIFHFSFFCHFFFWWLFTSPICATFRQKARNGRFWLLFVCYSKTMESWRRRKQFSILPTRDSFSRVNQHCFESRDGRRTSNDVGSGSQSDFDFSHQTITQNFSTQHFPFSSTLD